MNYYKDNIQIYSLVYLRHSVELHHGSSQRIRIGPERWDEAQHGAVKCSINLCQRCWTWVVDVHHRNMTQEPIIKKI